MAADVQRSPLLSCATEVLHDILTHVGTRDLASLSRTCRQLSQAIARDALLWKIHYLNRFDTPTTQQIVVWQDRMKVLTAWEMVMASPGALAKLRNVKHASDLIDALLRDVPKDWKRSRNLDFLREYITKPTNREEYLEKSTVFPYRRIVGMEDNSDFTYEERQLSARLHVLSGIYHDVDETETCANNAHAVHPYARSRVYDLRRCKPGNFWGPFTNDRSQNIDWERLQATMIDLSYNLRALCDKTDGRLNLLRETPFEGLGANSYVSQPLSSSKKLAENPLDNDDPYGISGTWMRIVCFLDYTHLYEFNFENDDIPEDQDREPISTEEAIRIIFMRLKVVKIEEPGEDDDPSMPVVHFTGTSQAMNMSWDPNANSMIRGTVRTAKSGVIRWTTFSVYHGEERWRSEGVQIGGIRSARGVMGTWFHRNYHINGPVGPTSFWKLSDDVVDERIRRPPIDPLTFF